MVASFGLATATLWCLSSIVVESGGGISDDIIADYAYLSERAYSDKWNGGKAYLHDPSKCLEDNGEGMKPDPDCRDCDVTKRQACADGYVMRPQPDGSCATIICSPPAPKEVSYCNQQKTWAECLGAKETRKMYKGNCMWHCDGHFSSGKRCEPKKWVEKNKQDSLKTVEAGSGVTCHTLNNVVDPQKVYVEPRILTESVTGNKFTVNDVLRSDEGVVWLATDDKREECIVVTRGSEQWIFNELTREKNDLDNNFDWRNQDLHGTNYRVVKGYYDHLTTLLNWNYGCNPEKDMKDCNSAAHPRNIHVLRDFIGDCQKKSLPIAVTGHSLGGAVAALSAIAFDQGALGLPRLDVKRAVMYGQVRVVATTGKNRCPRRLMDRSVAARVVNVDTRSKTYDPATSLPLHYNPIAEEFCFESYMLNYNNRLAPKNHAYPIKDLEVVGPELFGIDRMKGLHKQEFYRERTENHVKGEITGWPNGRVCDPLVTCAFCSEPATVWTNYAGVMACGKQPCWGKGTRCATCGSCCNGWKWAFPIPVCK